MSNVDQPRIATATKLGEIFGVHRSTIHRMAELDVAPKPVPWMKRRHWFVDDWEKFLRGETQPSRSAISSGRAL